MSSENPVQHLAIIVAGGKGFRMGSNIPKQFLPIGGLPILMRTIVQFHNICSTIVLVLPEEQQLYWNTLCLEHQFSIPHHVCNGGATRFESVRNGLYYLNSHGFRTNTALVAIHDGVRPFVSQEVIRNCFSMAEVSKATIPYHPVVESLRRVKELTSNQSEAVVREEYIAIQTPQVFHLDSLWQAYQTDYKPTFTDDASVWEATFDSPISLVRGNDENIKVTTPLDLIIAEELLK